ncbi:hypothetical protein, partial [Streptomyces longispororuber]|uniref:hypothetical protein n=1 Tax=Streptomyces longispororuber TaxID=68230 RepID=UPI00210CE92C
VSYAAVVLLVRAWDACEIGVNASANSLSLAPGFLALWASVAVSWRMAFGALAGRSVAAAVGVAVVATFMCCWVMVAVCGGAPAGYPVSIPECAPDNVPGWWPVWLPG